MIGKVLVGALLSVLLGAASAQDYEREARWAEQTLATLVVGDPVQIEQKNKHRFLGLYLQAVSERGSCIKPSSVSAPYSSFRSTRRFFFTPPIIPTRRPWATPSASSVPMTLSWSRA